MAFQTNADPKRWLVDTNVQIETVASKESLEKHPQPRAPGPEKLFDLGPDSDPEKACGEWKRSVMSRATGQA